MSLLSEWELTDEQLDAIYFAMTPAEMAEFNQLLAVENPPAETLYVRHRDAQDARDSLAEFFRHSWHVLEPSTPLVWNWHLDLLCAYVQAVLDDWIKLSISRNAGLEDVEQRIQNLIVNIPPGTAKSRVVSVCTTPWIWLKWPSWRAIYSSGSENIVLRDSRLARDLIESDWYRDWFKPTWRLRGDANAIEIYHNTRAGWRRSVTAGAKITGDRGDGFFLDDPNDAKDVRSTAKRKTVNDWWDTAAGNRVSDLRTSVRVAIMQRLDEDDWTGHALPHDMWHHLMLPMEYEQPWCECPSCKRGDDPIGVHDRRTTIGEVLDPIRFTPFVIAAEKKRLGTGDYAGQYQQRPAPAGGSIFKSHWWRYWQPVGMQLPPVVIKLPDGTLFEPVVVTLPIRFELMAQSWDMTFKDTKASDYVAGGVYGKLGADAYMVDLVWDRLDFTETIAAVRRVTLKWPQATAKYVEDKANGPAVITSLQNEIVGLIPINPEGDKVGRANAVTPVVEGGNFYLPHPSLFSWVEPARAQAEAFPKATYDDFVDQLTQLLNRWFVNADVYVELQAW